MSANAEPLSGHPALQSENPATKAEHAASQSPNGAPPLPKPDLQQALADFVVSTDAAALPAPVAAYCTTLLADTFGTMLAGSAADGVVPLLEQVREWGGRPQATIAVFGDRVPAPLAALVNAAMVHALDYDDTLDSTKLHANVCIVPALLAAAQAYGPLDGRALLAAHAVGLELACRLSLAAAPRMAPGWLPTTVFGTFGAAASVAKVLGLDAQQTSHALGIVWAHVAGNRQGLVDGALTKRLQPAFHAQFAVTAALLARRGITGASGAFEGPYGLFALLGDGCDARAALDGLGHRWELLQIGLKPYPCCRLSHASIDATFALLAAHRFETAQIREAVVVLPDEATLSFIGRPFAVRRNPQVDAQFSVAYCVAAALLHGRLGLAQFDPAQVRAADVAVLAARVRTVVDPSRDGEVSIVLADGRTLATRVTLPGGHPERPMDAQAMRDKLLDCAANAAAPLGEAALGRLLDALAGVADSDDAGALVALTVPAPACT